MKIANSLAVIMERVKEDILHARKNIKNLYERDVEVDYEFSHIPSDKEYRIFISVKAKEKSILDDVEKAYLSVVIKPFKDRITHIQKVRRPHENLEYVNMSVKSKIDKLEEFVPFPLFEAGKMYKGMEEGKLYTLKELGLE